MNYWHDLSAGEGIPQTVNVVVEIPKGSQNKYEYDKDLQAFKLDRVLFSPMHYPGDYGFIPRTLEEDGDPADALVLVNVPTYPGIVLAARPIALLPMVDNGEPDHKVLCVPAHDVRFGRMADIGDIEKPILDEIGHFFQAYKELEGKKVQLGEWQDAAHAHQILLAAQERYAKKFGK